MRFFSDNAAPCHPAVLDALASANRLDTAYDGDQWSARLDGAFSDLFETNVEAIWVTTGTAANSIALAMLCPPEGAILCHRDAHIENDEAGAPAFYNGGAKLTLLDGPGAKVTPNAVKSAFDRVRPDVHQVQPAALSITNATEYGLVYSPAETAALGEMCKSLGLDFHIDGARFANAAASTGASPADLTWRAGADALSFGFVKNGGMNAEAIVFFAPGHADRARRLKKRSGHLMSKGRYAAAQILALLEEDRWLGNARAANAAASALAEACGPERLVHAVEANELFVRMSPEEAAALRAQGFDFYDWAPGEIRLVTSWDQDMAAVGRLAAAIRAL
ncbi:low specificity L-threonine aldolase [Sphingomonas sp. HDW15A]|uniref:threonine aldolase family protein n=1 Tax=Sphingomonas sp. HDW15A TaxID=2714942 RepID=UPI00140B5AE3|nr:beta-eliminating lyase-related protein [Sphingomonas sp. HDW15A]QIK96785.1 low specificity L-threonine aldolase [Sphingomonas sp. HDW15A]